MPAKIAGVFFDIDGVLLDSLPQHLQICRDEAAKFGLTLAIPSVAEFRQRVSAGMKVSPMFYFFLAVGFPKGVAARAVEDYQRDFARHYRPKPFAGVEAMLPALANARLKLGLVTSNTRSNVEPALGEAMRYFDERCLFFFDRYPEPKSKSWCLAEGARVLNLTPEQCVYVGDQPADVEAAQEARAQFLGVTYGWGITKGDPRYRTVDSVAEISETLVGQRMWS